MSTHLTLDRVPDAATVDHLCTVAGKAGLNVPDLLLKLLAGAAHGLPAGAAMTGVHVMDGPAGRQPTMSATAMLGLAVGRGLQYDWMESTRERATLRIYRSADRSRYGDVTWTIQMAKDCGYVKPDKARSAWVTRPDAMLRARCITDGLRMYAPDYVIGVAFREELEDMQEQGRLTSHKPPAAGLATLAATLPERPALPEVLDLQPEPGPVREAAPDWRAAASTALDRAGLLPRAVEVYGEPQTWTDEQRAALREAVRSGRIGADGGEE